MILTIAWLRYTGKFFLISCLFPRASAESTSSTALPDVSEFALKLVSSDGSFSRAWDSLADFDPATKIPVGAYTMSAFYGDIDIEGFEKPFYLGETPGSCA